MDIFERAVRAKLRFSSSLGELTTEQLFDLPLTAKGNQASLDSLARRVFNELKLIGEISFVESKPDPRKTELTLQLDILKYVIESKKAAAEAAESRVKKAELRRQLTEALEAKKGQELQSMTTEQIQAKLAELSGE